MPISNAGRAGRRMPRKADKTAPDNASTRDAELPSAVPQKQLKRAPVNNKGGRQGGVVITSKADPRRKPVETPEQKRHREEVELRIELERSTAADEDERARTIARAIAAYSAAHATASEHLLRCYESSSRMAGLRAQCSTAEVAKLRSPAARKSLKADMKKGTGMSKRVQGMTEETVSLVLKDIASYALGRYAGEIAVALGTDTTLKATELEHAVAVAVAMHGRYSDFAPVLLSTILCAAGRAVEVAAGGEDVPAGLSGQALAAAAAAGAKKNALLSASLKPLHAALSAARSKVPIAVGEFGAVEGDAGGVTPAAITTAGVGSVDAKDAKAAAARLRTLLRLLLDLANAGVYNDSDSVLGILFALLGEPSKEAASIWKGAGPLVSSSAAAAGGADGKVEAAAAGSGSSPFTAAPVPTFKTPMPAPKGGSKESSGAGGDSARSSSSSSSGASGTDEPGGLPAPPVAEDVAAKAVQVLPLVSSILRSHGESVTGRPGRKTRSWLAASPVFGPYGSTVADPVAEWRAAAPKKEEEEEWMRDDDATKDAAAAAADSAPEGPHKATAWPYAQAWLQAWTGKVAPPGGLTRALGGSTHAYCVMTQAGQDVQSGSGLAAEWLPGHAFVKPLPGRPGKVQLALSCSFLSLEQQAQLLRAVDRYFDAVSTALLGEVRGVLELEARARAAQFARGGLGEALEANLTAKRASLDRLLESTRALAECLDRELPALPTEVTLEDDDEDGAGKRLRVVTGLGVAGHGPFDDPAEASFYRAFPSLEAAPRVLLDPEGIYSNADAGAAAVATAAVEPKAGAKTGAAAPAAAGPASPAAAAASPASTASAAAPVLQQAVTVTVVREANPRDRIRGTLDSALGQLSTAPVGTRIVKPIHGSLIATGGDVQTPNGEDSDEGDSDGESGQGDKADGSSGSGRKEARSAGLGEYRSAQELKDLLSDAGLANEEPPAQIQGAAAGAGKGGPAGQTGPSGGGTSDDSVTFAALLDRLGRLGSADDADRWAHDFVFGQLNSRSTRARLLKALFTGGRGGDGSGYRGAMVTDTLPFTARLVAVLDSGLPEPARLAPALGTLLEEQFKAAMKKGRHAAARGPKGGQGITTAIPSPADVRHRALRLIGELVKFCALQPAPLFRCAKMCVDDPSISNLALLGILIDTVGRHLFLRPDTNDTVTRMMDALRRVKEGTQVSGAQAAKAATKGKDVPVSKGAQPTGRPLTGPAADLIDGMLLTLQPPDKPAVKVKLRPPMEAFIRHVMLERKLQSDDDVDELLKILRKLPWSAPSSHTLSLPSGTSFDASGDAVERSVVKCMLSASRLDGSRIEMLMSALAGLKTYHERVAVRVVDAAIDRIITAVEEPAPMGRGGTAGGVLAAGLMPSKARQAPRVLGAVRILGHAYNYKLCDGPTLIRVLYLVVNSGHAVPRAQLEAGLEAANAALQARAAARASGTASSSAKDAKRPGGAKASSSSLSPSEADDEPAEARYARELHAATDAAMDEILDASAEEVARAKAAGCEAAVAAASAPRIVAPPHDPATGGWGFHPSVPCAADPPGDPLRARIVTAMLEVSGEFFCRGAAATRMDRFLAYFCRYVAGRGGSLPLDTAFALADAVEAIRPRFKLPLAGLGAVGGGAATGSKDSAAIASSRAEAEVAAAKLELDEMSKAAIEDLQARVEAALAAAAAAGGAAAGSAQKGLHAAAKPADDEDEDDEDEDDEDGDEEEDGVSSASPRPGDQSSVVDQQEPEEEEEEEQDEDDDMEEDEEGSDAEDEDGSAAQATGRGPSQPPADHADDHDDEDEDAEFDAVFSSFVREQADAARRNAAGGHVPMRLGAAPSGVGGGLRLAPSAAQAAAEGPQAAKAPQAPVVQFALLTRKPGHGPSKGAAAATLSVPASEAWVQQAAAAAAAEAAARDEHKRATLRLVQEQAEEEEKAARMARREWRER